MGKDAKLYYHATAATELASMTEASNVKDVTVNTDATEVDVSTRASGWGATDTALKHLTLEFNMIALPGNAFVAAIRDAFTNHAPLELCALTGARGVANADGPKGTWAITAMNRGEPLDGAQTYDVTAKLNVFDEWIDDGVEDGS